MHIVHLPKDILVVIIKQFQLQEIVKLRQGK